MSTPEQVQPIIFTATGSGIDLDIENYTMSESAETTLAAAIAKVRGNNSPPAAKVGFGVDAHPELTIRAH